MIMPTLRRLRQDLEVSLAWTTSGIPEILPEKTAEGLMTQTNGGDQSGLNMEAEAPRGIYNDL